ncbi:MAG: hypothetical protein EOM83_04200 [Clostridia bacterium]|nr:hypothetical protein [Clostridia bacterium]
MKMFNKIVLLFLLLVLQLVFSVEASPMHDTSERAATVDAPKTFIGHITAEPGTIVSTPVTITNFRNIGAISLTMHYDAGVLTWQSYINTSGFPGLFAFNPSPGVVIVSGFTALPEGFSLSDNSVLISFNFLYQSGNSSLIWHDDGSSCEYSAPPPYYEPLTDVPSSEFYINGSISSGGQSLQGTLSYHNHDGAGLPMESIGLSLLNSNDDVLASTTTNTRGEYLFTMIPADVTQFKVTSPLPWGGTSATDALAIQQRSLAMPLPFWQPPGFVDQVADVNASNTINATDALHVLLRSVGLINGFPAGDWAFLYGDEPLTNTSGNSATMPYNGEEEINIHALCYGDVNASYNLASKQTLRLVTLNEMTIVGQDGLIRLPIKIYADEPMGAITLFLQYDTCSVIIREIVPRLPGMAHNIDKGRIKVAWFNATPMIIENNRNIFTLVIELVNDVPPDKPLFDICNSTEFADVHGNSLEKVVIDIPEIQRDLKSADNADNEKYSVHCFPNPFGEVLNVCYEIPGLSQVVITLTGSSGHPHILLFDQQQSAGTYQLQICPQAYGLTEGVYLMQLNASGIDQFFDQVRQVIFLKTK